MSATALTRVSWTATDGWVLTRRALAHWARQPGQVLVTLLFPILIVLMFGYLFGGAMSVPGGGDYREFLLPGMFALTMVFGVETTFAAVTGDAARGVTDRFRSMPMARSAVVVGRGVADMLHSSAALAVLMLCGLAVGWQAHRGAGLLLAAAGLLLLLRFALVWVGVYLGLLVRNPQALAAVQILVWPLGFLSSAFVPPASMPGWLAFVAEWNPLSATAGAARELFGNPGFGGESWAAQHAIVLAVGWPVLLSLVFLPLAVRRFRRLDR